MYSKLSSKSLFRRATFQVPQSRIQLVADLALPIFYFLHSTRDLKWRCLRVSFPLSLTTASLFRLGFVCFVSSVLASSTMDGTCGVWKWSAWMPSASLLADQGELLKMFPRCRIHFVAYGQTPCLSNLAREGVPGTAGEHWGKDRDELLREALQQNRSCHSCETVGELLRILPGSQKQPSTGHHPQTEGTKRYKSWAPEGVVPM